MEMGKTKADRRFRALKTMVLVNVGIWAVSLVALVFVMQHSPGAKRLYPILGGGTAFGVALISVANRVAGADVKQA